VLRKVVVYHTRKHKNVKINKNCCDLKLLSFKKKQNTEFTRNHDTFKNSYLFKNDEK